MLASRSDIAIAINDVLCHFFSTIVLASLNYGYIEKRLYRRSSPAFDIRVLHLLSSKKLKMVVHIAPPPLLPHKDLLQASHPRRLEAMPAR